MNIQENLQQMHLNLLQTIKSKQISNWYNRDKKIKSQNMQKKKKKPTPIGSTKS